MPRWGSQSRRVHSEGKQGIVEKRNERAGMGQGSERAQDGMGVGGLKDDNFPRVSPQFRRKMS